MKNLQLCFLLALPLVVGCDRHRRSEVAATNPPISIEFAVDFGDLREGIKFDTKVASGTSVLELMQQAQQQGKMQFEFSGSQETAFTNAIESVSNEGAGGRNWIFFVDEKLAKRGCGSYRLQEDARVMWQYRGGGLE